MVCFLGKMGIIVHMGGTEGKTGSGELEIFVRVQRAVRQGKFRKTGRMYLKFTV